MQQTIALTGYIPLPFSVSPLARSYRKIKTGVALVGPPVLHIW